MSQYDYYSGGSGGGYVAGSPHGGANSPGGFGRVRHSNTMLRAFTEATAMRRKVKRHTPCVQ
ncbi:hypothetical protein PISMIDRAFT_155372 [Pisolithus microcarpus 441]|uniref:Uncharacterized protein n=1 Tax=Pisolithus microcarpus 441 TaxID=765257 RepID=A0A0C9Y3Q6_9AGAM|nr:hypothetical protein PISMIDRAFT_155372 [Pisolithus microcarpus 441]